MRRRFGLIRTSAVSFFGRRRFGPKTIARFLESIKVFADDKESYT